jgi:hypothetical protein
MTTIVLEVDNRQRKALSGILKYLDISFKEVKELSEAQENIGLYEAMKQTINEPNLSVESTENLFSQIVK